jgi:hypothetical protein
VERKKERKKEGKLKAVAGMVRFVVRGLKSRRFSGGEKETWCDMFCSE